MADKKKCSKCKNEKTLKQFHKYRNIYQSWCKLCLRKRSQELTKRKQEGQWF